MESTTIEGGEKRGESFGGEGEGSNTKTEADSSSTSISNSYSSSSHPTVLERIQRRHEKMEERSKQRKAERTEEHGLSGSAVATHFLKTFQTMRTALNARIEAASSVSTDGLTEYLNGLVQEVQELQNALNESSHHLASFQQKTVQNEVNEASAEVQKIVDALQPKKKFGFGRRKPVNLSKTVVSPPKQQQEVDEELSKATESKTKALDALDGIAERQFFGFRDEQHRTLSLSAEEINGRQLTLSNLLECRVEALGIPSTIQAAGLDRCTVVVGPAQRSAFIKNCRMCTFVLAGQQMRIHNTYDTDLYIHVTGAAIIEGCQRIRVAPYTLSYPDLDQHFLAAGLDRLINRWDCLDDFNWLNENEASPNWSIIPKEERRTDLIGSRE